MGAEAGDGAWVVLNFWANLRLAVLTRVVLTKKKRVGRKSIFSAITNIKYTPA